MQKNKRIQSIFWVYFIIILVSCGPSSLTEAELITYVNDKSNGLTHQKNIGEVTLQVTYRPSDLLVIQEIENVEDSLQVQRLREKYDQNLYFIFSMTIPGNDSNGSPGYVAAPKNYRQKLAFGMGEHIQLLTSGETLPMKDYVYNAGVGRTNTHSLLLVFDKNQALEKDRLTLQILEFGMGLGTQTFTFSSQKISATPKLKNLP